MIKNPIQLADNKQCTGCAACSNICPKSAISMFPDSDGFLQPYINQEFCIMCRRCEQVCPVLNPLDNKNSTHPQIYAVRAGNDIRSLSSSGGVFSVLANYVLSKDGYVSGAAFDESMNLQHVLINSEDKLAPLRGSKYLQSNIGTIYKQIKQILEGGQAVLFCGCPCQVSGLRKFLGKEYPLLYTLDLLCHGVPSQQIFSKYLAEISNQKPIKSVSFRDKKHGWSSNYIDIYYSDGSTYTGNWREDPYERGFYRNLFLRNSCEDCPFCEIPRQGDITIGDFWGIDQIDKTQNDGLGTSVVLTNNEKGEKLLEILKKSSSVKKIDVTPLSLPNRFNRKYLSNSNRNRFFSLVNQHSVKDAVAQSLDNKHDIGFVGNYRAQNFGGALVNYCLYKTLQDLGYSVLMIERPNVASVKPADLSIIYKKTPYEDYDLAPIFSTKQEMEQLNARCDKFLVGSDQLFQYDLFRELGEFVTLDWVKDVKLKVAYAASFGHDRIWGDINVLDKMAYFMQKFDYFSVRENSAVKIAKKYFGIDATWVLDPVLLCNRNHLIQLTKKVHKDRKAAYVGGYILDPSAQKGKSIREFADSLGLETEVFSEMSPIEKNSKILTGITLVDYKVEERIDCIANCDYFITDSFHGTCLSIIFRKPFITILNEKRGGNRFQSLLSHLGLSNRLVSNIETCNVAALMNEIIDYDSVYRILEYDRHQSLQWLKTALSDNHKKYPSDYDIMKELVKSQSAEISVLRRQIMTLLRKNSITMISVSDIYLYLEELRKQQKDCLIIVAVKDTPGFQLNEKIANLLAQLGLTISLVNKHWHSYIGILNGRKVIYEKISSTEEPVTFHGKISKFILDVESRSFHVGNYAKIEIDGKNYSVNRRGLNIVCLSKKQHCLIDSVSFDTHENLTCTRISYI